MAVTTTEFNNLLTKLKSSYPYLSFEPDTVFHWSPKQKTVWYNPDSLDVITLLHETAHGILGHNSYGRDTELLHLERDAWTKALEIGDNFSITIDESVIEDALDTYRDWIHARSLCPSCSQNGIQTSDNSYRCVLCNKTWQVNDARHCGLRRRIQK